MIKIHVNAVITVYDGFSGKAMPPSSVTVLLDGSPYRPEYRAGGHLVFCNLAPGIHEITLSAAHRVSETLSIATSGNIREERIISLKPGEKYPFGSKVTRLTLKIPEGATSAIIATAANCELKVAQDAAEAGQQQFKLYVRGPAPTLPGQFLVTNGKDSELCTLESVDDGVACVAVPLSHTHKRGISLYPCISYHADEDGRITAFFREPVEVNVFVESEKKLKSAKLSEGENYLEL